MQELRTENMRQKKKEGLDENTDYRIGDDRSEPSHFL